MTASKVKNLTAGGREVKDMNEKKTEREISQKGSENKKKEKEEKVGEEEELKSDFAEMSNVDAEGKINEGSEV